MNSYQNRGGRNYRRGGKQRGGAKNIMSDVSAELEEETAQDDAPDAPTRRQYSQKNGRRQNQKAPNQGGRQTADAAKKEQPIPLYKQIRGSGAKTEEPDEETIIAAPPENAEEDKNKYRVMSDYWFEDENDTSASASAQEPVEHVDIVGVRFKDEDGSKVYYFAPMGYKCPVGTRVIVETARGIEYGYVAIANKSEPKSSLVAPLRPVVRIATDADTERHKSGVSFASEAMVVCAARIAKHGLDMKLIDAEYAFDGSKLTFYFSAEGRVDFRELVKDLASVFHTRIELRQIGIRDEAKMLGGIGICGRPFCCSTFLYDFNKVSIEMAKEQGLSLNTAKISGACGRLMCCLRYEADSYAEEIGRTPRVGNVVKTPDGVGTVTESQPLTGKIKVKIGANDDAPIREYMRDDVTVLAAKGKNADKKAKEQPKAAEDDENVELPPED